MQVDKRCCFETRNVYMKIFVIDISGKVILYDMALCDAIRQEQNRVIDMEFFAPLYNENPQCKTTRLINLVPLKYKNGEYLWKRAVKLIELLLNNIVLLFRVAWGKPDVIHFQWFPLLEVCSGEHLAVKMMKLLSKRTKVVLTIHNVYPHTFSEENKAKYLKRFQKISKMIDSFIVHTEETKRVVTNDFRIEKERVNVVHHGIFTPSNYSPKKNMVRENELHFIMYGNLSDYKGVDIFVEAISKLPETYKKRVRGVIAGEMQNKELCKKLQKDSQQLNIEWYPYFLPEQELNERIENSNVIVLPYKHISQSGVLLLALYFRRYIITSDLPTFKETLHGFTDDMFFKSENSDSLALLMMRYVDGKIDTGMQMRVIESLNEKYSWNSAAKKTIRIYRRLTEK